MFPPSVKLFPIYEIYACGSCLSHIVAATMPPRVLQMFPPWEQLSHV